MGRHNKAVKLADQLTEFAAEVSRKTGNDTRIIIVTMQLDGSIDLGTDFCCRAHLGQAMSIALGCAEKMGMPSGDDPG